MNKRPYKIALQPDRMVGNNKDLSFSDRMQKIISNAGHQFEIVDVLTHNPVSQVRNCNGFIWRFFHAPHIKIPAKRII